MDYHKRIDAAYTQISAVKSKVARRDLLVMLRATEAAYTKLDKESVECRRLRKETPKYAELEQECRDLLTNIEQHITFASLLG
jgi:hypothetical protein